MPFRVALSGLNAATSDLNVTANNIANSNTTGFKSSRAEFADVFAAGSAGGGGAAIGNGVRLSNVSQQFTQGNIEFTDSGLDLAINGQGFFTLRDGSGFVYTRNGSFSVDRDGYVVNAQNQRLEVYESLATGGFNTGSLVDLRLQTSQSMPSATTFGEVVVNVPASATPPPVATFDPTDPQSYTNSTSSVVYDSLGNLHQATFFFVKTANPNEWSVGLTVDGNQVGGLQTLQFSSAGVQTVPAGGNLAFPAYDPANGAQPLTMTFDFGQATQYGGSFAVSALNQDGFSSGRLTSIDISDTGVVFARFTNGRALELGKVALSNFPNAQGLRQLGETAWGESFASGGVIQGEAGSASFGLIQSGALEGSNVDLTKELVQMITSQRAFQANAQMISTADSITQTIINIR
ncbi:MAG: flagellar hook protein FlgE [Gammaproteobacteria bacterium]|nr:MAG: flagellar hook protein FlgE [Gammaproteobacteria bacterium]